MNKNVGNSNFMGKYMRFLFLIIQNFKNTITLSIKIIRMYCGTYNTCKNKMCDNSTKARKEREMKVLYGFILQVKRIGIV